jgi:hypothetical protein
MHHDISNCYGDTRTPHVDFGAALYREVLLEMLRKAVLQSPTEHHPMQHREVVRKYYCRVASLWMGTRVTTGKQLQTQLWLYNSTCTQPTKARYRLNCRIVLQAI